MNGICYDLSPYSFHPQFKTNLREIKLARNSRSYLSFYFSLIFGIFLNFCFSRGIRIRALKDKRIEYSKCIYIYEGMRILCVLGDFKHPKRGSFYEIRKKLKNFVFRFFREKFQKILKPTVVTHVL